MRVAAAVLVAAAVWAPAAAAAAPSILASVDHPRPRFGDPFTYVVEASSAPADALVIADPGPFTRLEAPVTRRSGSAVVVTQRLACLDAGCVPSNRPRSVSLPRPVLRVGGTLSTAEPVVVSVVPRVPRNAVRADRPEYRATTAPGSPTARFGLRSASILLGTAGVGLLALGVVLVAVGVAARRRRRRSAALPDPFALAARLLRQSAGRPPPDRRRAASLLSRLAARETAAAGAALAGESDRVAWSRPEPRPEDAEVLADRAEALPRGRS
jgi:hypothetical protein